MKSLKPVLAVILAVGLVVGLAFPVMAKSDKEPKAPQATKVPVEVLRGKVTQIDPGKTFFFIQQEGKDAIKITVSTNTTYYYLYIPARVGGLLSNGKGFNEKMLEKLPPGKVKGIPNPKANAGNAVPQLAGSGKRATFDDIGVGDRVAVRVDKGTTLAKQVIIMEPALGRVNGTITAISTATDNTTITIAPLQGGNPVTVKYNGNTLFTMRGVISLAVGQYVQVVYRARTMIATTVNVIPPRPTPLPTPPST